MDNKYEEEYMRSHDCLVTKRIHKVVNLCLLLGPALYIFTKLGLFADRPVDLGSRCAQIR